MRTPLRCTPHRYAGQGNSSNAFPWGPNPSEGRLYPQKKSGYAIPGPEPVGKYSPKDLSPFGVADMLGNVWQYTDEFQARLPMRTHRPCARTHAIQPCARTAGQPHALGLRARRLQLPPEWIGLVLPEQSGPRHGPSCPKPSSRCTL